MRWRCSFHFRFVRFTLRVNLARSDRHDFICNFASISCGLRQMKWVIKLFHRSEFRDRKEDQIFQIFASQAKNMRECKDCVIGREITTELKITVDNAILELRDSCDFFGSPLIKWCAVVSTVINESSRAALECALRSSKTLFFTTNSSQNMCKFIFLRKVNYMTFQSLNPRQAKNVIRNADWEAIYHFLATTHRHK